MPRSTTLTLTTAETALLFGATSQALDFMRPAMTQAERRIANSLQAKVTAALIATQKPES